ncbi:DUF664 domain-containing protein [Nocardioides sp. zg-DK7169]|uniref:mycothiol transferase n=1 Tax=Nocardioides sp. zg-DK7169 TaxID=2736600 RepID=UPI0015562CFD|nr:DUF664 domain-containing protein [Nocardioides sp. zg-DK7169]NPC97223.1 DUF664 domain-containing protein [Nocardioides sp. zg-DK7169]
MTPAQLLSDGFGRVLESGTAVVDGLSLGELSRRPGHDANPIGWLVWHLTRVQDDHVAEVAGRPQVWTDQDFVRRFDLPLVVSDTGYGHTRTQVDVVRAEGDLLAEYLTAVHAQTLAFLATVGEDDLDRVVDTRWDPPVTLGVRLVSVLDDDLRHVGQAEYVRGLLGGRP